jgi:hypothetical protein
MIPKIAAHSCLSAPHKNRRTFIGRANAPLYPLLRFIFSHLNRMERHCSPTRCTHLQREEDKRVLRRWRRENGWEESTGGGGLKGRGDEEEEKVMSVLTCDPPGTVCLSCATASAQRRGIPSRAGSGGTQWRQL